MTRSSTPILGWLAVAILASAANAQPILFRGSDTLVGLNQKWAKAYATGHSESRIEVGGGGAAAAFGALAKRDVSGVLVTRSMRYREAEACTTGLGQRPVEYKLAVNGLAVYVNKGNAVPTLTYDELFGVFSGKVRNWKEVGGEDAPILAGGVATNGPVGELFLEEVLSGKAPAAEVRLMADEEILDWIAKEPNAIGFAVLGQKTGIRAVAIKRAFSSTPVEPNEESIANRIYPISRFLFCYVSQDANPAAKSYVEWIRTDEGQKIAREAGFFPLPAKWRTSP